MFSGRPVGEILILLVAGTVCFAVLAAGSTVAALTLWRPEVDTSGARAAIADILNTLIGLVAGFLAGHTDRTAAADRIRHLEERLAASDEP